MIWIVIKGNCRRQCLTDIDGNSNGENNHNGENYHDVETNSRGND